MLRRPSDGAGMDFDCGSRLCLYRLSPPQTFNRPPDVFAKILFHEIVADDKASAALARSGWNRLITGERSANRTVEGQILYCGYNMAGRDMYIRSILGWSTWGRELIFTSRDQYGVDAWLNFIDVARAIGALLSVVDLESLELGLKSHPGVDVGTYKSLVFDQAKLNEHCLRVVMRAMMDFQNDEIRIPRNLVEIREQLGRIEQRLTARI